MTECPAVLEYGPLLLYITVDGSRLGWPSTSDIHLYSSSRVPAPQNQNVGVISTGRGPATMGQVQSQEAEAAAVGQGEHSSSAATADPRATSSSSSMESLLAEAAAYGDDENESPDAKAQKALECPCIADLRSGPCGVQFSEAFLCFLKSSAEEKGSDCVHPFVALQNCIKANPNAFSKDILEDDEVQKEEEPTPEYQITPPVWSKGRKSKL